MEDVWEIAGRRELQVRCTVQVDAEVMEMPHMASKRLARTILCLVLAILTGACSSLRHGGAPDPMYSVSSDLESLKAQFKEAASIQAFYSGDKSAESRNRFLDGRVALANTILTGEFQRCIAPISRPRIPTERQALIRRAHECEKELEQ